MNRTSLLFLMAAVVMALGVCPAQTPATPDSALWGGDSPYLKALAQWYKIDPVVIVTIGQGTRNPLDTHVNLFLTKAADVNPMELHKLRQKGISWVEILDRYRINPAILFTPLDAPPPGEFARAYRQRDKYAKDPCYKMLLYDPDIRNLTALKFCIEALGMKPSEIFDESKRKGRSLQQLILDELEEREEK
jgi:hypothetical protein